MPKWLKILLIVLGCLIILVIGAIVAAVYFGRQFVQSSSQSMTQGQEFGRKTENTGCVVEAVTQYKKSPGFSAVISSKLFLTGCLNTSRPSPGFCTGVPRRTDFSGIATWGIARCKEYQLGDDQYCPQIFASIPEHCEKKGESTPND